MKWVEELIYNDLAFCKICQLINFYLPKLLKQKKVTLHEIFKALELKVWNIDLNFYVHSLIFKLWPLEIITWISVIFVKNYDNCVISDF
jgi:hypothetical protein